jgi:MoaA/NifB/PqqE/SkfB family radical SAM enzyme
LKKLGVRGINLGGGEPLLRRDLPIIVTKAKSLGLIVNLTTNGILLSQRVAEDLLRRRLDSIVISIDGIGQTNDYIRGIKGLFERNLANLKMLAKLRDLLYPSLHVEIATTLMKPTLKDIKSLVALCTNLKISISFNLIDSSPILFKGISIKDLWIKDKGLLEFAIRDLHSLRASYPSAFASRQTHVSLEYIRDYFADPKQDQLPCILGYIYICVDPHGNVYPGCWVLPPVDNLRSRTLHEIFFSKKYRQRIAKMFKKQCPGCACGYQTNLIFDPKSIIKEVSWRLSFLRR